MPEDMKEILLTSKPQGKVAKVFKVLGYIVIAAIFLTFADYMDYDRGWIAHAFSKLVVSIFG
jgi:hypothetical protein